jgi:hypothetical protein
MGLRPLVCRIEGPNAAGGMNVSLVIVVCYQIEVSAKGRSLMKRCPVKSGVSECDPETSNMSRTRQTKDVKALKKNLFKNTNHFTVLVIIIIVVVVVCLS